MYLIPAGLATLLDKAKVSSKFRRLLITFPSWSLKHTLGLKLLQFEPGCVSSGPEFHSHEVVFISLLHKLLRTAQKSYQIWKSFQVPSDKLFVPQNKIPKVWKDIPDYFSEDYC